MGGMDGEEDEEEEEDGITPIYWKISITWMTRMIKEAKMMSSEHPINIYNKNVWSTPNTTWYEDL